MDGGKIKLIAFALMLLDHAVALFLPKGSGAWLFIRGMGRLSFPMYAYLASQGIRHTHDTRAYSKRLLIYAFLSEFPFDMAFFGRAPAFAQQNVFFTLALSVAVFWTRQANCPARSGNPGHPMQVRWHQSGYFGRNRWGVAICIVCAGAVAQCLHADYGMCGVFLIGVLVYADGDRTAMTAAVGCFVFAETRWLIPDRFQRAAAAAATAAAWSWIVGMDNGGPGNRKWRKWFYVAYPAHLAALWMLRVVIAGE